VLSSGSSVSPGSSLRLRPVCFPRPASLDLEHPCEASAPRAHFPLAVPVQAPRPGSLGTSHLRLKLAIRSTFSGGDARTQARKAHSEQGNSREPGLQRAEHSARFTAEVASRNNLSTTSIEVFFLLPREGRRGRCWRQPLNVVAGVSLSSRLLFSGLQACLHLNHALFMI
jgi:hypothetical protein